MAGLPAFLRLAAHPVRWQLLTALATGDYRVRELVALVDQPQNLVSYHLRLLRTGGLVTAGRSSFDGRDSYYHLDLDRCSLGLADIGTALVSQVVRPQGSVLFICTGNSARSPIAEALLRRSAPVEVVSAGSHPKARLHPEAVRVLREDYGIDVAGQRPRHLDTVRDRRFDHVISLCDKVREVLPAFPGDPRRTHWSIPDPQGAAFRSTAAEIGTRIRYLLPVLEGSP